jgi:hypothetical protein
MTHGFQQQEQGLGYFIPRATPLPQHGRKADNKALNMREPRSVSSRRPATSFDAASA